MVMPRQLDYVSTLFQGRFRPKRLTSTFDLPRGGAGAGIFFEKQILALNMQEKNKLAQKGN